MDNNKPNKHKNSFLKFLPKAASAVSFQNPPFSPGRDRHHHGNHHAYKGFSGPINFAMLPDEAREKPKNGSAYESHEPTSPKISCMGQIKCKHHKKTKKPKKADNVSSTTTINDNNNNNNNTKSSPSSMMRKFFGTKKKSASKGKGGATQDDDCDRDQIIKERTKMMRPPASGLGQMRKFASGRETLRNFDWTAHQIAPIDNDRDCYSDEERRRKRDDDDEDDDEDEDEKEVIIPFSAPMMLGGGSYSNLGLKPRKEVNLWKRRTMDPPPPLALKSK